MKIHLLFLVLLMFSASSSAGKVPDSSVRIRPGESLCAGSDWELCGAALMTGEKEDRTAYIPLRRSGAVWDEGAVRKVQLDKKLQQVKVLWQTESVPLREVYRPVFLDGSVQAGKTAQIQDFDADLAGFCGMNAAEWAETASVLRRKDMGAPYPAAMTLAEGVLYVLCDDGILCAISAETGRVLWNLLLPQACFRLKYLLHPQRQRLPWLCAGALTAEKNDGTIFLWGTLGRGGRGVFCVRVSKRSPEPFWARETFDETVPDMIRGCAGPDELGLSSAAPVSAVIRGKRTLILSSGHGVPGRILLFDALTGALFSTADGASGSQLILSPLVTAERGVPKEVICCDSAGGFQRFLFQGERLTFLSRTSLEEICACGSLDFIFSPLGCHTARGPLAVFIAGCSGGTVISAMPTRMKNPLWSESQRRTGTGAWWTLCRGFEHPFAVLCSDGILYLLGWQEGCKKLLAFDLEHRRTIALESVSDSAAALISVSGKTAVLSADDRVLPVSEVPGMESVEKVRRSAGIIYTLQR